MRRRKEPARGSGTSDATEGERDVANQAGLHYVSDSARGIRREKRGRSFTYIGPDDKSIRDRKTLDRIAALVIPPAWKDVWICCDPTAICR